MSISNEELHQLDSLFFNLSIKTLKSADINFLTIGKNSTQTLLRYDWATQNFIIHLLFRRKHDQSTCPEKLVEAWKESTEITKNILQKVDRVKADADAQKFIKLLQDDVNEGSPLIIKHYPACTKILGDPLTA